MRLDRRLSLAGQLLVLQLAIVVVVLVAVAAVSLAQSASTFNRVEGRRVTALAEQLAGSTVLRDRLTERAPGETLAPLVQTTLTQSGVTSVAVADIDGQIVAATDPRLVGTRLVFGDAGVRGRPGLVRRARVRRHARARVAGAGPQRRQAGHLRQTDGHAWGAHRHGHGRGGVRRRSGSGCAARRRTC